MKKAVRSKNIVLIIAIFVSVSFAVGIPMIPLGFVGDDLFMGITGIVLTAHGFYGVTFYWIWFAGRVSCVRLVRAVDYMHIYTVDELCSYLGKDRNSVVKNIRTCINKGWIAGLLFDGNSLYANDNDPIVRNGVRMRCSYCDTFYIRSRNMLKCPACGAAAANEVSDDKTE